MVNYEISDADLNKIRYEIERSHRTNKEITCAIKMLSNDINSNTKLITSAFIISAIIVSGTLFITMIITCVLTKNT